MSTKSCSVAVLKSKRGKRLEVGGGRRNDKSERLRLRLRLRGRDRRGNAVCQSSNAK
jgi:hypothetical protein